MITSKQYIQACKLMHEYEQQQIKRSRFLTLRELKAKDPEAYAEKEAVYNQLKSEIMDERCHTCGTSYAKGLMCPKCFGES